MPPQHISSLAVKNGFSGGAALRVAVVFVTGALVALTVSLYLAERALSELAGTGDLRGAMAQAEWAARLNPFSPDPLVSEAKLELLRGRQEAAVEALREAIRRNPADYENHMALGDLQEQHLGNSEAATESYREALERNPHAVAVIVRLAETLSSAGDLEGAKAQYEWLRERGKVSYKELYDLGKIQLRLGETGEAIQMFKGARGNARAKLESLDESEKAEREAYIESADLAIADALVVQGKDDEAREELSQSEAEQAPKILALLEEDPEAYRESVLDAPAG